MAIEINRTVARVVSIAVIFAASAANSLTVGPSRDIVAATVDRPGGDYRNFNLSRSEPNSCLRACVADSRCVAWTYVKPNIQGPNARCWLKDVVPVPRQASCCHSGVINVIKRIRACERISNKTGGNPAKCINGNDGKAEITYRRGHIEIFANLKRVPLGTHKVTAIYKKRSGNRYVNFSGNKQEFNIKVNNRSYSIWFTPKYFGHGDYIVTIFLSKVPGVSASTKYQIH